MARTTKRPEAELTEAERLRLSEARAVVAELDAWSARRAQGRADERLWDIARGDARVMADLQAALASFSRVALLGDPADAQIRPLVEESILKCIDLSDQLKRYQDELDSCDQYLKLFPTGAKVEDVRKKKADAKLKAVHAAAMPEPAPADGAAASAPQVP